VCFGCPVRVACLIAATERRELWGVWGGVDFETVRALRAVKAARPADDSPAAAMAGPE
jgi:hypothetical protein